MFDFLDMIVILFVVVLEFFVLVEFESGIFVRFWGKEEIEGSFIIFFVILDEFILLYFNLISFI